MANRSPIDATPFRVAIPEEDLEDLRDRLARTRWPEAETTRPPDHDAWDQGTPLAWLQALTEYWRTTWNWRRAEARLNAHPQFTSALRGPGGALDIHYLHVRSPHADALPLLLTHGWPGSVFEFVDVIGALVDPPSHGGDAADAFHVVCPSLPGFGFSAKPTGTGWDLQAIGRAWHELMTGLGYGRYVAQGGDWGGMISQQMAVDAPAGLVGIHTSFPIVTPDPETLDALTDAEQAALGALQYYQDADSAYARLQGTRPQSIGYGLVDSPVAQLAWIAEKFHRWMACDGDPLNVLSRDALLDNVALYWLTGTGASSARIYWESLSRISRDPVDLPVGCSIFPAEFMRTSRRWAEKRFSQLVHFRELDAGGHFPTLEVPDVWLTEVRDCFRTMR